jgi:hypothetical protein
MNRQEPLPLTPQMMWIAAHPTTPWLPKEMYQYATDPITAKGSVKVDAKRLNVSIPASFDAQDAFVKHLAGKVRVEDES